MVAMQDRHIIKFLRELGHSNGDVYIVRSGSGGHGTSIALLDAYLDGLGSDISKAK
jgi:hypothetical protein